MIFDPPFIKTLVNPGEPVTAESWNDIVTALSQVHLHLEATEATALKVQVTNPGIDLASVRVSAIRADGVAVDAVAPVAPSTQHIFSGLSAGSYALSVAAPGYQTATAAITAPDATVQNVALTPSGAFMPGVFGLTLQEALATLNNALISVSRVLDVTGTDVPTANPGAQYSSSRVLMQLPDAGSAVPTGQSVQLVIAAVLAPQPSIEIPPLTGLTLAEAQKALESLGLVLGKVVTKQGRQA
ncbi:PASTA domain-containing protein [Variovorax rhizosphaerae]|uniref:PASTA domain-containing protein n=1 Tax=Variovorax rhizosphaerae TaxID=1836200 RepID=A0ABU8WRK1_9BURK